VKLKPEFATHPARVGDVRKLFRVKIVADSVRAEASRDGVPMTRLTSYQLTYPRVLLAEVNTHRMLSRSSESSRALPGRKRLAQLSDCPYFPLRWGAKIAGMGAGVTLEEVEARKAADHWLSVLVHAMNAAEAMIDAGLAKEELNRITEPFALVRTVITASAWDNFFALRCHEAAHPAFQFLAKAMYVARGRSTPDPLRTGQWHLPYIRQADIAAAAEYTRAEPEELKIANVPMAHPFASSRFGGWEVYHLCRWSAARCARVSYGLLDGKPATPEADDETWSKLAGNPGTPHRIFAWNHPKYVGPGDRWPYRPVHASPMEHQGTPEDGPCRGVYSGNLPGWVQFRKMLGGENVSKFDVPPEVVLAWAKEIPEEVFSGPELY
jgi:hypothetical protein